MEVELEQTPQPWLLNVSVFGSGWRTQRSWELLQRKSELRSRLLELI